MSTLEEIETVLPNLSTEELYHIERSIYHLYRQRKACMIYDDAYGVWTEEDQVSAASDVFALMDEHEGAGRDAAT